MSISDINPTSRSWGWTNQTLMSSWHRRDNRRYPRKKSSRIVYIFSISHNNAMFILWQLKNQSFMQLFFSCSYEKYVFYFKTALLYLEVISNIVSDNIYWERCTKILPNQVWMYTIHSLKIGLKDLLRTSCPNGVLRMSLRRP